MKREAYHEKARKWVPDCGSCEAGVEDLRYAAKSRERWTPVVLLLKTRRGGMQREEIMKVNLRIGLPVWIDRMISWPVILYRRMKYGYAYRRIYLDEGMYTIVDPQDFYEFGGYNWYAGGHGTKYYAMRTVENEEGKITTVRLHREIMRPAEGNVVDHRDGNSLDNRRENMREATQRENMYNRKKRKNTSSRYVGARYDKERGKWASEIKHNGKKYFLGRFDSEIAAAKAYDAAAKKYRGEFARLNFPEEAKTGA